MANTTADKLAYLAETKQQIKTAIENKGVSIPDGTTFRQYAEKVGEISGGGIPSYVPPREVVNGVYKIPNTATSFNLGGATSLGSSYILAYAFYENKTITTVDFSSLTTVDKTYAFSYSFYECINLTSANLSSLTTINADNAFNYTFFYSGLTSADLGSLTTVIGNSPLNFTFYGCTNLTSVNLSSLTTINGVRAMAGCFALSKITRIDFPSLKEILPATTQNQFGTSSLNYIFNNCIELTEIHFPSNMEARVSQLTGYADKWGAPNATIYFDLPSTEA